MDPKQTPGNGSAIAADPRRKLKGMLARIFSDAKVEPAERAELSAYLGSGALASDEIKDVVEDFVRTTWKITIADGVVSDSEKKRLRAIVGVLGLSRGALPDGWAEVIAEPHGEWVMAQRFVDATAAEMAADFLRTSGIPVIVQGQHSAELLTKAFPVEVDLLVESDRLVEAREALAALDHGTPVDPAR